MRALQLRQQQLGHSIDQFCKFLRANRKAQLVAQKKKK